MVIDGLFLMQIDHSSFKAIEVQLDCLEFFLSTIPESLLDQIGEITYLLLSLNQRIKRNELKSKCLELLHLIREILSASIVLPNFIHTV